MRTEISTKFTRERLESVYAGAGLEMCGWFTDAAGDYAPQSLGERAIGASRLPGREARGGGMVPAG